MCEICRQSICPSGCPNAPDPPVFGECVECGELILVGDDYYDFFGDPYCEKCVDNMRVCAEEERE